MRTDTALHQTNVQCSTTPPHAKICIIEKQLSRQRHVFQKPKP